jgi:hypothetical protein
VFSNYGHLSNETLLYAYGFAICGNPADSVTIKLSVARPQEVDGTESKEASTPRKDGVGEGGVFYIGFGGFDGVPKVNRSLSYRC